MNLKKTTTKWSEDKKMACIQIFLTIPDMNMLHNSKRNMEYHDGVC